MEEVKKKDILLNLADLEDTARVCRALSSETRLEILKCLIDRAMTISELAEKFYLPMSSMCLHIKTLREANLISVVPKPGIRGSQKLCGMKTTSVTLDLFAHVNKRTGKPPAYIYMPIGHYSTVRYARPAESPPPPPTCTMKTAPMAFTSQITSMQRSSGSRRDS